MIESLTNIYFQVKGCLLASLLSPGLFVVLFIQFLFFGILFYFFNLIFKAFKISPDKRKNFSLLLISIFSFLWISELALQVLGVKDSYVEKSGKLRSIDCNYINESFQPWEANGQHFLGKNEFQYKRTTNSLGLSDKEWQREKLSLRIIALGDSFTEGDGAPMDSSWVSLAGISSKNKGLNIEWLNAGICGSDPVYEYELLENKLLKYNPDIVIVATHDQDYLQDLMLRGGFERFEIADELHISMLEILYGYSRIARLVLGNIFNFNELLIRESPKEIEKIKEKHIPGIVNKYEKLATLHDFKVVFVYFPSKYGIMYGHHQYDFDSSIQQNINDSKFISAYSLLPCFKMKIDTTNSSMNKFWWQQDGHLNSKGYQLMADCIFKAIEPELK